MERITSAFEIHVGVFLGRERGRGSSDTKNHEIFWVKILAHSHLPVSFKHKSPGVTSNMPGWQLELSPCLYPRVWMTNILQKCPRWVTPRGHKQRHWLNPGVEWQISSQKFNWQTVSEHLIRILNSDDLWRASLTCDRLECHQFLHCCVQSSGYSTFNMVKISNTLGQTSDNACLFWWHWQSNPTIC